MKRAVASIIIAVLALTCCFTLFACNPNQEQSNGNDSGSTVGYSSSYLKTLNSSGDDSITYTAGDNDIEYGSGEERSPYSRFYTVEYDKIANPRYAQINSWILDENKIYLIYLGYVNNVPVAYPYGNGVLYNGGNFERQLTKKTITESQIEKSVSSSTEKSFSRTDSANVSWGVEASIKSKINEVFFKMEAGVSIKTSTEYGESETVANTSAFTQSQKNVQTYSETLEESYKLIFDSSYPAGYYRPIIMGQLDVFATVVYNEDIHKYQFVDTYSIVNTYYDALDYSATDPDFSDTVAEPLQLKDSVLESLPEPTDKIVLPGQEEPVKYIDITLDYVSKGQEYGANDSATVSASKVTVQLGNGVDKLPVPKCSGYSFVGWFLGNIQITDANGKWVYPSSFNSDRKLNARWLQTQYTFLDGNTVNGKDIKGNHLWKTGKWRGRFGTWYLTNDYAFNVNFTNAIDVSKYKLYGYNKVNIKVMCDIAEINKGYQCVRVQYQKDAWDEFVIEHGGGGAPNTNYSTYSPYTFNNKNLDDLNSSIAIVCRGVGVGKDNAFKLRNLKVMVEISK